MESQFESQAKKNGLRFEFVNRSDFVEAPNKRYYFLYFQNYQKASALEKQFLKNHLRDLYKTAVSEKDVDEVLNWYLETPNALDIDITFIVSKETQKLQGFTVYIMLEAYLIPGNFSNANKYVVSSGLVGINPEFRRGSLYKDLLYASMYLNVAKYPNCNYLHFDVSVTPISFYMVCKSTQYVFPSPSVQMNDREKAFLIQLIKAFQYEMVDKNKVFLVKDDLDIEGFDASAWKSGYEGFPEEIKFYIDQTALAEGVGIAFLAVGKMIKDNTMGLPAKIYATEAQPYISIIQHTFTSPKL